MKQGEAVIDAVCSLEEQQETSIATIDFAIKITCAGHDTYSCVILICLILPLTDDELRRNGGIKLDSLIDL